ncbi:MAG: hypothetical protein DRQ47_05085, partial [Gammaproteobacteria bacterium]
MNNRIKYVITTGMWLTICVFFLSSCDNSSTPKEEEPPAVVAAELMSLAVADQTITPDFDSNTSNYTLSVDA